MTPGEKASLRIALFIVLPTYAAGAALLSTLSFGQMIQQGQGGGTSKVVRVEIAASAGSVGTKTGSRPRGGSGRVPDGGKRAIAAPASPPAPPARKRAERPARPAGNPVIVQAKGDAVAVGVDARRQASQRPGAGLSRDEGPAAAPAGAGTDTGAPSTAESPPPGPPGRLSPSAALPGAAGPLNGGAGSGGREPAATAQGSGAGRAAGRAGPPPVAGSSAGNEVASVLRTIEERIRSGLSYPVAAQRRGIQGVVTVAATIGGRGALENVRVVQSSGSTILDQAGVELLRRVFPIANPLSHAFTVEVPIVYRLETPGGS